jgi:putative spermidine/putrescine transport system permease protein
MTHARKWPATAAAWWVALPLLALVALGVLMPFVLRSSGLVQACVQHACPVDELISDDYYLQALINTLTLSIGSTMLALPIALASAVAVTRRANLQGPVAILAGVGANFSGVPLALGLTILLGSQGVVTLLMQKSGLAGIDLQRSAGLMLAYLCFQVPLALILLMEPVRMQDAGLREAAATLGASDMRFWWRVGLPVLAPSLVETATLLFANAAAAYATPFALAGTSVNVLAVRIAALTSGDLFADPNLSALLALIMAGLLVTVLMLGRWLSRRMQVPA